MRPGDLLAHRRQEALRVEEAGQPEHARPAVAQPAGELRVPVEQVREPEPERRRLPRYLTIQQTTKPSASCHDTLIKRRVNNTPYKKSIRDANLTCNQKLT